MLVLLYNWEEAHCSYSFGRIIHPRAMNKGIYYSLIARVSIDTPQPDGSVVNSVFKHLGFIIIFLGIMVLKRAASASLIMPCTCQSGTNIL
jgi:hypothetical protein